MKVGKFVQQKLMQLFSTSHENLRWTRLYVNVTGFTVDLLCYLLTAV